MVTDAAYAACFRIAREHYENFPVASWLVPAPSRPHIAAIYAFARTADDFADEGTDSREIRLARLDDWRDRLHDATAGRTGSDSSAASHIFAALGETMRTCGLEVELFDDLLSAFRQDVEVQRYATWDDLLDYCRRSANPIGRLVLRVTGHRSEALDVKSDAVCTALQLTNFWQDVERDWTKGRLYVPLSIVRENGADIQDLDRRHLSPAWKGALQAAVNQTRVIFARGRSISDDVGGRLGWELRATWLGGMRILERIEAVGFDVFHARPTLDRGDALRMAWRTIWWR